MIISGICSGPACLLLWTESLLITISFCMDNQNYDDLLLIAIALIDFMIVSSNIMKNFNFRAMKHADGKHVQFALVNESQHAINWIIF
jgi:hypothetical protein